MRNDDRSLSEVHASVPVSALRGGWRKLLAFAGPAYLVSVGYMDPGNWATDIAGGSRFGYQLLWVLLMSNLMALLLQSLSARLGIVRGLDLAQASRHTYPRSVNIPLYVFAEVAIAACDLAEVIGMAIGLQLLFGIPVLYGVLITALDALIILFLMQRGVRVLEAFIISIVAVIGMAFLAEILIVGPEMGEVVRGLVPSSLSGDALYIAIGIIGATVMPHNLYLHSALVQTRRIERSPSGIREALRFNFIDTGIALNIAFLVNAAILVLASAAFHSKGFQNVAEIQDAHTLLKDLFGDLAPTLFAIALIGSGQSSTITGTLAGQIVMEGYLDLRIRPWLRRLLTRMIAIVPAVVCILVYGEGVLGELLVLSQVILSLQLGFAVIPLIHFNSDRAAMKEHAIPGWMRVLAWCCALVIVGLNARLVVQELSGWLASGGGSVPWIAYLVVAVALMAALLLIYVIVAPFMRRAMAGTAHAPHGAAMALDLAQADRSLASEARRVAVTVDFSRVDGPTIRYALSMGGPRAIYHIIHVNESAVARYLGKWGVDREARSDAENIKIYVDQLRSKGYTAFGHMGNGHATRVIPELVDACQAELLVMGAHGHRGLKDLLLGATVDTVRHRVRIPVLVVR